MTKWVKNDIYKRVYDLREVAVLSPAWAHGYGPKAWVRITGSGKNQSFVEITYIFGQDTPIYGINIRHHISGVNATQKAMRWAEYMLKNPVDYVSELNDEEAKRYVLARS